MTSGAAVVRSRYCRNRFPTFMMTRPRSTRQEPAYILLSDKSSIREYDELCQLAHKLTKLKVLGILGALQRTRCRRLCSCRARARHHNVWRRGFYNTSSALFRWQPLVHVLEAELQRTGRALCQSAHCREGTHKAGCSRLKSTSPVLTGELVILKAQYLRFDLGMRRQTVWNTASEKVRPKVGSSPTTSMKAGMDPVSSLFAALKTFSLGAWSAQ